MEKTYYIDTKKKMFNINFMSIHHLIFIRIKLYINNFLDTNEKLAFHQEQYFLNKY